MTFVVFLKVGVLVERDSRMNAGGKLCSCYAAN